MPRRRLPKDPQAVRWSTPEDKTSFTQWLCEEIQGAVDARATYTGDGGYIDTWHSLYEQAERPRHRQHWPDSADLASYLPTEKIDALRARLSQVVFGPDPICTVEGWGERAERVAKCEAFHQWKAEEERLQSWVTKACHQGLIEGNGILEVTERYGFKKSRGPFKAAVQVDEWQRPILDDKLALQPQVAEDGTLTPWSGNDPDPYVEVLRERVDPFSRGPQYRVLSCKEFVYLPGHAKDLSEVWGYARRIHLRVPDLTQRVAQGLYDAEAVEALGTDGERDQTTRETRQGLTIAAQEGPTAEKELWEVNLLRDIDDDDIEEWLIVCVSTRHQRLLRAAFDPLEQARFVSFVPFPRPDSVYGYSFLGHKLWTLTEEHTALRNMKADRQALALNAPLMRMTTSAWDPDDQPFGPGAVIDVRQPNEITQLQIADVPASTIESERSVIGAAERLSGLSDQGISGVMSETRRTATENRIVSQASEIRVEEAVRHIQEGIEDLYLLRNRLWQRALSADETGVVPPERIMNGLEMRGIVLPKDGAFKFAAADLDGAFRFKPRGSVETADKGKMRSDLADLLRALPALGQMFPLLGQRLAMNLEAGQELLEQLLRLYGFQNLQVFLRQQPGIAAPQGVAGALPPEMPPMLAQGLAGLLGAGGPAAPMPEGVM